MSEKIHVGAAIAALILIAGGLLYTTKRAEAVAPQAVLNSMYHEYLKSGDVSVYYDMCALAVNTDPDNVPKKVMSACTAGL